MSIIVNIATAALGILTVLLSMVYVATNPWSIKGLFGGLSGTLLGATIITIAIMPK